MLEEPAGFPKKPLLALDEEAKAKIGKVLVDLHLLQ